MLVGRYTTVRRSRIRPEEQVRSDEVRGRWVEAIDTLPTKCARVCPLLFLEGYTQAEVASRLRAGRRWKSRSRAAVVT